MACSKAVSIRYRKSSIVVLSRLENEHRKISSTSTDGVGGFVSKLSYRPFGGQLGLTNGFGKR